MKKYTKPTAKIIELSVKESLSAIPDGFKTPGVQRRTAAGLAQNYAITAYSAKSKNGNAVS